MKKLNQAILLLKTKSEVDEFLNDLCTPAELKALDERWAVAQLLYRDEMSYREIAAKLNASTTTITRVARFLTNEPYKGYQKILKRINNEK
ncbi:YerC/YecD family TrpR-related protein [Gammaproteobacteria bacterium]|jgi:TrpR-related protein YerC/YecD|nr:transcriptional regulator [Flavobacteriaceae bacterium]MDA7542432.1 YerC/YecD family TrpR-related protein [Gammaproteobacteria bacterium]MDA9986370.1 YerC/YecD family TrpR-related protein [bacterium]MDA7695925.1 YerC/YecD family TrpR-related protein [Gammaproteobacteria bacterium]MDA7697460.1 YerC/YecD family TrpR-related protein [Gammaproteobacteria bacterium]|tara:strand:- start:947 stop:1219 length:273 start_codon:yes stop_codon:yes gene_type:complete